MQQLRHYSPLMAGSPVLRWLILAGVLAACGLAALAIDCPVAEWFRDVSLHGDLRKPLSISESFGHGYGVLMILLAVYVLDPGHRWALPRVTTTAFGAGLATNIAKILVGRTRPRTYDFHDGVWHTFTQLFPLDAWDSANQSFVSAHTATAVGLAFGLTWLYPRGRWLFAAMAVLVACQRIECGAHYPSDTLLAAALGCVVAVVCIQAGPTARWFDRKEEGWKGRGD
jgi:membrane-associated phospholipid phosphatase